MGTWAVHIYNSVAVHAYAGDVDACRGNHTSATAKQYSSAATYTHLGRVQSSHTDAPTTPPICLDTVREAGDCDAGAASKVLAEIAHIHSQYGDTPAHKYKTVP